MYLLKLYKKMRLRLYLSLAQILERNQKQISLSMFRILVVTVFTLTNIITTFRLFIPYHLVISSKIQSNIVINKHLNFH